MKQLILAFFTVSALLTVAQNQTVEEQTDSTTQKFVGVNIASIITNITQGSSNSNNFTLRYREIKANNLIFQASLNLKSEEKTNDNYYCFTDTTGHIHKRTYTENLNQFDIRVGVGIYEKLGYGHIYLVSNLLVGYTQIEQTNNDLVNYMKNGAVEGIGNEQISGAKAGYFTAGIDFAIGYEINLGKSFMLGLEYVPELTYNTIVSTDYYLGDSNNSNFNASTINSYFNVFNVNLYYHF